MESSSAICFFLAAIDADSDKGVVDASVLRQPQFRQNASQLPLAVYQIVDPLDFGADAGCFLHSVAGGYRCGAGQMQCQS